MAADGGPRIRLRHPDSDAEPPGAELIRFEPDELVSVVETEAGGTALMGVTVDSPLPGEVLAAINAEDGIDRAWSVEL